MAVETTDLLGCEERCWGQGSCFGFLFDMARIQIAI